LVFPSQRDGDVIHFATLWKKIDFFICLGRLIDILMRSKDLNNEARSTARQYCADLFHWKQTLKSSGLSNHSLIYGEIGWPSGEGDIRSLELFETFWKTLSSCSSQNNLDINVFNIVDEVSKAKVTLLNKTRDKFGGYGILKIHSKTNNKDEVISLPQLISVVMSTSTPKYLEHKQIPAEKISDQPSPKLGSSDRAFPNSSDHNSVEETSSFTLLVMCTISFVVVIAVSIVAGLIYFFNRNIIVSSNGEDNRTDIQTKLDEEFDDTLQLQTFNVRHTLTLLLSGFFY